MNSQAAPALILEEIERAEQQVLQREPDLQALLPEQDRFARIRQEAETLLRSAPVSAHPSQLFGTLIGVKDIFRVDGFPTRAGSRLHRSCRSDFQAGPRDVTGVRARRRLRRDAPNG